MEELDLEKLEGLEELEELELEKLEELELSQDPGAGGSDFASHSELAAGHSLRGDTAPGGSSQRSKLAEISL